MRWPWLPRQYEAVREALQYAEEALHRSQVAANRQAGMLAAADQELTREDRDGRSSEG